ncbi:MAG: hypothetical protein M1834_001046 [Cirrosporium novae-zelandiae]|nr:MAG: hypothetical protein M1834_001046 [Cirrosporium novae-zelandiae]
MSDTNEDNAGSGDAATNKELAPCNASESGQKRGASKLWCDFEAITAELFQHAPEYSDISDAMDQKNALELELKEANRQNSSLELCLKEQMKMFEERYAEWAKEKNELITEKDGLKSSMAAAKEGEMEEKTKELAALKEKVESMSSAVEKANTESGLTGRERDLYRGQLKEWERYVSQLEDIDLTDVGEKIDRFFYECYNLFHTHFFVDLPMDLLADYLQWEKRVSDLNIPLSFPATNSSNAKGIRVAAALHVLSTHLYTFIFKPCYIPETESDSQTLREILSHQVRTSTGQETHMRALLLFTHPPDQITAAIERTVQATTDSILNRLNLFLPSSSTTTDTFRAKLPVLLHHGVQLWRTMQSSQKMIEVSIDDENFLEWPWSSLDQFGTTIAQPPHPPKFDLLNLFPRFLVPEDSHSVHSGYVLWGDQELAIVADQERTEYLSERRARVVRGFAGAVVGTGLRRERRYSRAGSDEDRRAGSLPSSPTTRRFSFLERDMQRTQVSPIRNAA